MSSFVLIATTIAHVFFYFLPVKFRRGLEGLWWGQRLVLTFDLTFWKNLTNRHFILAWSDKKKNLVVIGFSVCSFVCASQDLLKHTPKDHPDFPLLQDALRISQNFLSSINEEIDPRRTAVTTPKGEVCVVCVCLCVWERKRDSMKTLLYVHYQT